MLILRLAWKEIVNQPRTSVVMLFTLILGLVSFVGLDLFRGAVETTLRDHSQKMLAADLVVTGRRSLTPEEQATIMSELPKNFQSHLVIEMYSMAKTKKQVRLVQIKGVPPDFPYYGSIDLPKFESVAEDACWLHPELLEQLQAEINDIIEIGNLKLKILGIVKNDFVNSWRGMSLAPKIYMSTKNILASGLIQKGSTLTYSHLYKLPLESNLEQITRELNKKITDPALRILSHSQAADEYGRGLSLVSDYLALVTLVALFLTGVGINFIFGTFLWSRTRETAVLISLGLTRIKVVGVYLFYLCFLVIAAWVPAWLLGMLMFPYFQKLVLKILPLNVPLTFDHKSFLTAGLIGIITIIASCLLSLLRLRKVNPSLLFDDREVIPKSGKKNAVFVILGLALGFWGISVMMSHSFKVGSLFIAVLCSALFVFWVLGYFLLKSLGRLGYLKTFTLSYALKSLSRMLRPNLLSLISLGVGCFLLTLVPQIRLSLEKDIVEPEGVVLPDFFMFDIQEEQVGPLDSAIKDLGYQLDSPSPLVRAKLNKVNDASFEKWLDDQLFMTREEEVEKRFRNRGFNLSFKDQLSEDEKIVSGTEFTKPRKGKLPQISIEARFAKNLKLKVGDRLEFDVQGENIAGEIVNLRSVRWSSFRPNFFVIFETGVLEALPKTYLASLGSLNPEEKTKVQVKIVDGFPNISMVDVQATVARIRDLVGIIVWAINFMALLCMVQSFVIVFAISFQEAWRREGEWGILKLLGISKRTVAAISILQSSLLSVFSTLVGIILGSMAAKVLCRFVFETTAVIDIVSSGLLLACVVGITLAVTYFVSIPGPMTSRIKAR